MPRKNRQNQSLFPYHVTLRTNNKVEFAVNIDILWNTICDRLLFCTYAFNIQIHSFVLMPNHFHMILGTPDANLSQFMLYFNRELSKEIERQSGQINQKFGSRYHACLIGDLQYYSHAYKYVYRNPVSANLSLVVEDYPYSSLQFLLGKSIVRFPIFETYFDSLEQFDKSLAWLNLSFSESHRFEIKKALRSSVFTPCV